MTGRKNPKANDPKDNVPSGKEQTTPATGKTWSTRSGTATTLSEGKAKSPETLLDPSEGLDPIEDDPLEELIDYNEILSDEETVLDGSTSSAKQIAAKAEAVAKVAKLAQGVPTDTVLSLTQS